ncbi:MAG: RecQ family ATP-dependent DNA helicase [Mariprofundaceae bacterium]|nr:RecQ family ATP-dependent DNA helicase [Mariprofundaceae bacterium]
MRSELPNAVITMDDNLIDTQSLTKILNQSVFIDLEIHPETNLLLKIGAWEPKSGKAFYRDGQFDRKEGLNALFEFSNASDFIVGHNIQAHDWPYLIAADSRFNHLSSKLIDTLILNPLAFPENPYHHLVKDYKMQRESINDPVADCKQTEVLFSDQCHAFIKTKDLSGIYGRCLITTSNAYKQLFTSLLGSLPNNKQVNLYLSGNSFGADKICQKALKPLLPTLAGKDPEQNRAFAYALAWLSIAGTNSVLPAWVRHQHKELAGILNQLRSHSCERPNCGYCKEHHHLETNLDKFFHYKQFRHFGKGDNPDNPLQKQIVASVCKGQATLAILPTGGGKSLCYQLPAMMLARNRGMLTIIISPLQSLMNDQVQQLKDKGYLFADALNSSLSMLRRHAVLEGIRKGNIHLLYIAPEQLRNTSFIESITSREIGQWIIDEAHCLSKWGHDFRPDYLYIGKFIKAFSEQYEQPIPPVHAFTATARQGVIKEIKAHFKTTLNMDMCLLSGGHARNNLTYQVLPCPISEKREKILELIQAHDDYIGNGAIIIFCNRRRTTEDMASFLSDNGCSADYFHAGRNTKEKQRIQQSFMHGNIKVMAATNAFGMGVDKSDIRLVIHAQMPDSIENYLQEAGRAGRDSQPAKCILLFNDDDVDKQFEMRRNQQIEFRDFVSLFEAIRRKSKTSSKGDQSISIIQVSSGEILRHAEAEGDLELGFDGRDYQADTKVRTAIAWLEEKKFLERKENKTGVIEGTFLIHTKEKIKACLQQQKLSEASIQTCLKVAMAVMQFHASESINVDQIAEKTGLEARDVFRKIRCLQDAKIMDHDMSLVAWLAARTRDDSKKVLHRLIELEKQLLELIQEKAQGDIEQAFQINIYAACHQLRETSSESNILPNDILLLLALWGQLDDLVRIMPRGKDCFQMRWKKEFVEMKEYIRQRHLFSDISLAWLYEKIPTAERGKSLRVAFKLGELEETLNENILTRAFATNQEWSEKTLLALEKSQVLGLDSGAAIFHPAMTLHIPKNKNKPTINTYTPLAEHYQAQIRQIHLMREWAIRMSTKDEDSATQLLNDYFQLSEKQMLGRYFPENLADLDISATAKRVESIVGAKVLSDVQQGIVQQAVGKNMLVLAGPGSGKTRLLVHRVAWLVCVQRIKPESILILAFNRSTVTELRRRLGEPQLLGSQAYFLEIHTYHSLAMRLLGEFPPENADEFQDWSQQLIAKASEQLSSDDDDGDSELRRKLMAGFQHILVDEYQDINQGQYDLLSAMAGRSLHAAEDRLTMFAVGDDDQNIYEWNGSNNKYIQQFENDYHADIEYMTVNYRSSAAIVAINNLLIEQHPNRLKKNHPITPCAQTKDGKVRLFTGTVHSLQAKALEICQYLITKENIAANRMAILCRDHNDYQFLAPALRNKGLPICIRGKKDALPWYKLREVHAMLKVFDGDGVLSAVEIHQAWGTLPQRTQNHQTTKALWYWLDAYHNTEDIVRSRYEWRAEIRELSYDESRKIGQGIHLGTMHSAKGLEFDTVIVFAGKNISKNKLEELRLRYVAMTRAERNLILMQKDSDDACFNGLPIETESLSMAVHETPEEHDIYVCNMSDVALDFAGHFSTALHTADIDVGSVLTTNPSGLLCSLGSKVGKFSKAMHTEINAQQQNGWQISSIKVHAVIRRYRTDSEKGSYQEQCKQNAWDVILPEISFQKNSYVY